MNDTLEKFFRKREKEDITKWSNYFDIYEKYFSCYKNRPVHFLEIGVDRGGSSEMWKEYFGKDAVIVGIDIDKNCKRFENISENRYIEIGDQSDPVFLKKLVEKYRYFDIILDDGSHIFEHQKNSLQILWDSLSVPGIYMVEDTQTSYYPKFGGGNKISGTFIEYAKELVDEIYSWHRLDQKEKSVWQTSLEGISFYSGIVVLKKNTVREPYSGRSGKNAEHTAASQEALCQASHIEKSSFMRLLLWQIKVIFFTVFSKNKAEFYRQQLRAKKFFKTK